MRQKTQKCVGLLIVASLIAGAMTWLDLPNVLAAWRQQDVRTTTLSEQLLRRNALETPKPSYPAESLRTGVSGLAVIEILIDTHGKVERARVLQAPDEHISKAVASAVSTWRFTPLTTGPGSSERKRAAGKIFFYFEVVNDEGMVLFPDEFAKLKGINLSEESGGTPAGEASARAPSVIKGGDADFREIDEATLADLSGKASTVVIDVRDRNAFRLQHRVGSKNLPMDELASRGATELSAASLVVIDCTRFRVSQCRLAAKFLERQGIQEIAILVRK